jgi:cysteinyl-tRNA synthetase
MLTVDGQKMGKSLGNFITLKQAFAGDHPKLSRAYDPLAIRQLVLTGHYRNVVDFSDAALTAAQSGYEKIKDSVLAVRKQTEKSPQGQLAPQVANQLESLKTRFEAAMNDDLNTAVALSVMFELAKLANSVVETANAQTLKAIDGLFRKLGGDVLGIVKDRYDETCAADEKLIDYLVNMLIESRAAARKNKDFAAADNIRKKLDELGIVLEDKPGETVWRRK